MAEVRQGSSAARIERADRRVSDKLPSGRTALAVSNRRNRGGYVIDRLVEL